MPAHKYTLEEALARFWERVDKTSHPNGCWLWIGSLRSNGYGRLHWSGKTALAHRVSYEIENGAFSRELDVLHKCDNPQCVNPEHLFLGTDLDNNRDMMQKGRARYLHGEQLPQAKLSKEKVQEIRERYAAGGVYQYELAREYGVAKSSISYIINRINWK